MSKNHFRKFGNYIVPSSELVVDVLKKLNDTHRDYRTEGIVYMDASYRSPYHEIFFSYVEDFYDLSSDTEE